MKWLRIVVALETLAACDGAKVEPNGLGNYRFGHTTIAGIHDGNCQPTELRDGRKDRENDHPGQYLNPIAAWHGGDDVEECVVASLKADR